jgi:DNA-binding transcriptional LysR family regulator
MFIDPSLLRTFLAFADTGSLARAASSVGRSASAVTAQMQRLEELIGEPLLSSVGRGRILSPAGEQLVPHARRILEAHRDAWLSIKGARAEGRLALGTTQDFADTTLPDLLRAFARTHPLVRLELRVGRSQELERALQEGTADVILAMRGEAPSGETGVLREPMVWLGAARGLAAGKAELPLALLDAPCAFRAAALAALERAAIPYRIAATSSSLSGLKAAVKSGIAITLRTPRWSGEGVVDVTERLSLPVAPEAVFAIRIRRDAGPAATAMGELLLNGLSGGQGEQDGHMRRNL